MADRPALLLVQVRQFLHETGRNHLVTPVLLSKICLEHAHPRPPPQPRKQCRRRTHRTRLLLFFARADLGKGENRTDANPNDLGEVPCFVLPDGTMLSNSTSMCVYLDEKFGATTLIGTNAKEKALTHMWVARLEDKVRSASIGIHVPADRKLQRNGTAK